MLHKRLDKIILQIRSHESVSFLQRFYRGSVRDLVAALSGTGDLTGEDLDELRDFLNQQGRESHG